MRLICRRRPRVGPLWLVLPLVLAACGPAGAPAASGQTAQADRPSLLLVTIDTWRWDHIGVSGAGKVATPNLDNLAREGQYERAVVTPCPLTTPAHASLLTGLRPEHHRVMDCIGYALPPEVTTLAEIFRDRGFRTAAFVSSQTLQHRFGFDRGFDVYDDGEMEGKEGDFWTTATRDGALTTAGALEYLRQADPGRPLFLWIHYFDAHVPYRPRPVEDAAYPGRPYAAQVAYIDRLLARLLEGLRAGPPHPWRILIAGDHGEGLGDHGEKAHGIGLYRSTLDVPLILHPRPAKRLAHERPWTLVDLLPTICEWYGWDVPGSVDGESLFAAGSRDRVIPCITLQPTIVFAVNPNLGIRRGPYMYMRHGIEELYDLDGDPDETRNLAERPDPPGELAELRSLCQKSLPSELWRRLLTPTLKSSPEELRRFRSLGYLGGSSNREAGTIQRIDLRTVFPDSTEMDRALAEYGSRNDLTALLALYPRLIKKYPGALSLFKDYGVFLLQTGRMEAALPVFEAAYRLNKRDPDILTNLGALALQRGDASRAQRLLELATELDPYNFVAQKNLGVIYSQYRHLPDKAIQCYRRYLELRPAAEDAAAIRAYILQQGGIP